jgi:hypothetical protein
MGFGGEEFDGEPGLCPDGRGRLLGGAREQASGTGRQLLAGRRLSRGRLRAQAAPCTDHSDQQEFPSPHLDTPYMASISVGGRIIPTGTGRA